MIDIKDKHLLGALLFGNVFAQLITVFCNRYIDRRLKNGIKGYMTVTAWSPYSANKIQTLIIGFLPC